MKRQKCFVAAAFAFIVIASFVAALNANCMLKCFCGQTHVDCTGVIPEAVAVSVRSITLKEIHYSEFHPRRFCNVTYTYVTDLTIYSVYFKLRLYLFKRRIPLEIIDLSYNQLTALPKDTFKYNANLRELNLQGNRLQQITFNASHIFSLEILDLRNNSFEFLDGYSRRYLERRQETNCSSLSFAF